MIMLTPAQYVPLALFVEWRKVRTSTDTDAQYLCSTVFEPLFRPSPTFSWHF
ncbi:hypothetical protein KCP74_24895 [Salmonella enterica subsp. enterica]|nr:hypothetical protein KCP74_24895 [Salmonella enterica subsp. enterica]